MRAFLAIPLPTEVKNRLLAIPLPSAPAVRPVKTEHLHLTLHFLGELSLEQQNLASKALSTLSLEPFSINLDGVGVFPEQGEPRVLWVGVQATSQLLDLHRVMVAKLSNAIGYEVELRPYTPHVTLARLKGSVPQQAVTEFLTRGELFDPVEIPVQQFALYSSQSENGENRYREECIFPLKPK